MNLFLHPKARREADRAADHYAEHDRRLGVRFARAVVRAIDAVTGDPGRYPLAEDSPDGFDVRNYVVPGFPYRVLYWATGDRLMALAFAHHSQQPGYWHDRMADPPPEAP